MSFDIGDDVIDSRDVIEFIEEFEAQIHEAEERLSGFDIEIIGYPIAAESNLCYVVMSKNRDLFKDEYFDNKANAIRAALGQCGVEDIDNLSNDDIDKYHFAKELQKEFEGYGDWEYGDTIILREYFVEYIEELIKDCYPMPKDMDNGNWPWCYLKMDWEGAASAAEQDYSCVQTSSGHEYLMRSV